MSDRYDEIAASVLEQSRGGPILAVTPERTAQLVAAALRASAEEEREACALGCEEDAFLDRMSNWAGHDAAAECAKRIRARRT